MKKQPIIRSEYNPKEKFSFEKTPGEFNSVTKKSITDIKNYCSEIISRKYKGKYDSRILYAMVGTIMGNFDLLTSKLNDDCASRRSKLKKAQSLGVGKVNILIFQFEKTVADYNTALKRYDNNIAEYDGSTVDEDKYYSKDRLQEFKKRLKIIEEKNHDA